MVLHNLELKIPLKVHVFIYFFIFCQKRGIFKVFQILECGIGITFVLIRSTIEIIDKKEVLPPEDFLDDAC